MTAPRALFLSRSLPRRRLVAAALVASAVTLAPSVPVTPSAVAATAPALAPWIAARRRLRSCRINSVCARPTTTAPPTTVGPSSTPTTTPTTSPTTTPPTTLPAGPTVVPPFAATSAFRTAIPASVTTDPNSTAQVAALTASATGIIADLYADAVPIYTANATTPRSTVACTANFHIACDFASAQIPIPTDAKPTPNGDAPMVVIDPVAQRSYEFWQAVPGTPWTTSWGTIVDLGGPGNGTGSTGAGISRLAGVIRTDEIRSGVIDHPLVFSTTNACRTGFRWPATKTDGSSSRSDCIPQGARVQLDPTLDLNTLTNLRPGERAIAVALQKYGAYAIDNGGSPMAFVFELPRAAQGPDPYPAAGFAWDYWSLGAHIPFSRLRVLATWNG